MATPVLRTPAPVGSFDHRPRPVFVPSTPDHLGAGAIVIAC